MYAPLHNNKNRHGKKPRNIKRRHTRTRRTNRRISRINKNLNRYLKSIEVFCWTEKLEFHEVRGLRCEVWKIEKSLRSPCPINHTSHITSLTSIKQIPIFLITYFVFNFIYLCLWSLPCWCIISFCLCNFKKFILKWFVIISNLLLLSDTYCDDANDSIPNRENSTVAINPIFKVLLTLIIEFLIL